MTKVKTLTYIAKQILNINSAHTGKNVTIAYIDTGIFLHLDFCIGGNRILKFVDLINQKAKPYDDNGHGTFVAGVGSGNGFLSCKKFAGIAPQSNIIMIKALNQNGEATAMNILEAMRWILDNKEKYNIKVVCMSFGSEPLGEYDPIKIGAEELWKNGICVVAAAGNSGPDYQTIKSPGISPEIITVGGIDDKRENEKFDKTTFSIPDFSSRGPALNTFKPDIVAPSVNITSCSFQGGYTTLSGTSVATPMIAGLCALIYENSPEISVEDIKRTILHSAEAITFNLNFEGYGLPNASKIFT